MGSDHGGNCWKMISFQLGSSFIFKSNSNSEEVHDNRWSTRIQRFHVLIHHKCTMQGQKILSVNCAEKKGLPPIHVYYLELWDTKYKYNFENLCNNLISPLISMLSCKTTPCMSKWARKVIWNIGDWYVSSEGVYFRIHASTKSPHLLPHYVSNKLVLLEFAYHTYVTCFGAATLRNNKIPWPKFPLQFGSHKIESMKQVEVETEIFKVYQFGDMPFYKHDPKDFLNKFYIPHNIT